MNVRKIFVSINSVLLACFLSLAYVPTSLSEEKASCTTSDRLSDIPEQLGVPSYIVISSILNNKDGKASICVQKYGFNIHYHDVSGSGAKEKKQDYDGRYVSEELNHYLTSVHENIDDMFLSGFLPEKINRLGSFRNQVFDMIQQEEASHYFERQNLLIKLHRIFHDTENLQIALSLLVAYNDKVNHDNGVSKPFGITPANFETIESHHPWLKYNAVDLTLDDLLVESAVHIAEFKKVDLNTALSKINSNDNAFSAFRFDEGFIRGPLYLLSGHGSSLIRKVLFGSSEIMNEQKLIKKLYDLVRSVEQ